MVFVILIKRNLRLIVLYIKVWADNETVIRVEHIVLQGYYGKKLL